MRYKGIIMKYVGISRYKAIMESHYEKYIWNHETKIICDQLSELLDIEAKL